MEKKKWLLFAPVGKAGEATDRQATPSRPLKAGNVEKAFQKTDVKCVRPWLCTRVSRELYPFWKKKYVCKKQRQKLNETLIVHIYLLGFSVII